MDISRTDIGSGGTGVTGVGAHRTDVALPVSRTRLPPSGAPLGLTLVQAAAAALEVKATCGQAPKAPTAVLPSPEECVQLDGETVEAALERILGLFAPLKGVNAPQIDYILAHRKRAELYDRVKGDPVEIYFYLCVLCTGGRPISGCLFGSTSSNEQEIRFKAARLVRDKGLDPYEALSQARIELLLAPLHNAGILGFDPKHPEIFETDTKACVLGLKLTHLMYSRYVLVSVRLELFSHQHPRHDSLASYAGSCLHDETSSVTEEKYFQLAAASDEQIMGWIASTLKPWLADHGLSQNL